MTSSLTSSLTDAVSGLLRDASGEGLDERDGSHLVERLLQRLELGVKPFRERPQMMDGVLAQLVRPLMEVAGAYARREGTRDRGRLTLAAKALVVLTSARGSKAVCKTMPHTVHDVVPVFDTLCELFDARAASLLASSWEVDYTFLLWTSLLVLMPFSLEDITGGEEIAGRMMRVFKGYMEDSGPTREAACVCAARLLIRPDCVKSHLGAYLSTLSDASLFLIDSVGGKKDVKRERAAIANLTTVVAIYKRAAAASDAVLANFARAHLASAMRVVSSDETPTAVRRLAVKLLTRFVTSTRGEGGGGEMAADALGVFRALCTSATFNHQDTVVRYATAKAVARVVDRMLTLAAAGGEEEDEKRRATVLKSVVESLLRNCFSRPDATSDADALHGGCLTLAEMLRRVGLARALSKDAELVGEIVRRAVIPCLTFDKRRATRVLGAHVRDAASYVVWALARFLGRTDARNAQLMSELAESHVVRASIFDRDVNCRRAAAAAYQECVGRWGRLVFPRGIEVMSVLEFSALANASECHGRVLGEVCEAFGEGAREFEMGTVGYLITHRLFHWDPEARVLGAIALGRLAERDPEVETLAWETLRAHILALEEVTSARGGDATVTANVNVKRHGLILAVTQLVKVRGVLDKQEYVELACNHLIFSSSINTNVPSRSDPLLPLIASARCELIACVLQSSQDVERHPWLSLEEEIIEAMKHHDSLEGAKTGLKAFARHRGVFSREILHDRAMRWSRALNPLDGGAPLERLRAGHALECLLPSLHGDDVESLIAEAVARACDVAHEPSPECRVRGVALLFGLRPLNWDAVLTALDDYQTDKDRGDVGAAVRIAVSRALCSAPSPPPASSSHAQRLAQALVRQAVEPMNAVREAAMEVISVLGSSLGCPPLEDRQGGVEVAFDYVARATLARPSSFLLDAAMFGAAMSYGGLTEASSKAAETLFSTWWLGGGEEGNALHHPTRARLADGVLRCLRYSTRRERFFLPMLRTLAHVLELGFISQECVGRAWVAGVMDCLGPCSSPSSFARMPASRLLALAQVFWHLANANLAPEEEAWERFLMILSLGFPKLREEILEYALIFADGEEDGLEEPMREWARAGGSNPEAAERGMRRMIEVLPGPPSRYTVSLDFVLAQRPSPSTSRQLQEGGDQHSFGYDTLVKRSEEEGRVV